MRCLIKDHRSGFHPITPTTQLPNSPSPQLPLPSNEKGGFPHSRLGNLGKSMEFPAKSVGSSITEPVSRLLHA